MFFTDKHKQQFEEMQREINLLKIANLRLQDNLQTQGIRLTGLMKAYPHGTTRTGEPRKKPGRKSKVQA